MEYEVKTYEPSGMRYDAMRYMLLGMGSNGNMYGPSGKDTMERDKGRRVWDMKPRGMSQMVWDMMI